SHKTLCKTSYPADLTRISVGALSATILNPPPPFLHAPKIKPPELQGPAVRTQEKHRNPVYPHIKTPCHHDKKRLNNNDSNQLPLLFNDI
ncbi:hypothetical protein ACTXNP_07885, partial [Pseudomonas helleri]|uniref:hypothetical protein n=1 Tax=Pseudomonas helleri TaxID=1608996 RepID=UPI003FD04A9A